jgi:nicotinate-nucleotide pyrophosphorylase (carboxylating)
VSAWLEPSPHNWWHVVEDALAEDVGSGDISGGVLPENLVVGWRIEAQADGILSGIAIAGHLLEPFEPDPPECTLAIEFEDGAVIRRGDVVATGSLPARRVMMCERTALNFLMHMSGVATLTAKFVAKVEGTQARIIDTRKTLPVLRGLQKYAVRCGGGHNHRMGLYDAVMLKDNHIRAAGSIAEAARVLRGYVSHLTKIEIECESLEQVAEAVAAGADVVLLDNMDPFDMAEAVKRHKGECMFEASGGISLDTVRGVAQTGVDLISIGMLTHSAPALPFHLELE